MVTLTRSTMHNFALSTLTIGIIIVLTIGIVAGSHFVVVYMSSVQNCDTAFESQIGISGNSTFQLCLKPLVVEPSSTNSSEIYVPVLIMKAGGTGTIDIFYRTSAASSGHQAPPPPITPTDAPLAFSVTLATTNTSRIGFSNGTLIFQNKIGLIYRYNIYSSVHSRDYYAILPYQYYGFYPALVIGARANNLNMSQLSMWGYDGVIVSGEDMLPSTIVGTSGFTIVYVTVPAILNCPNVACTVIIRSAI